MTANRVTAALIVRNEEGFLIDCLESLKGAVDGVIVVDTGSTDASRQIARNAGATVIDHEWTNDFAAARNVALDHVDADWVLYIDADERVSVPVGQRIASFVDPYHHAGGYVRFQPKSGYTSYKEPRLFRSDPSIRFRGQIHETHVPDLMAFAERTGSTVVSTPIAIHHLGYDGDQSHKVRRNLPLLEAEVLAHPERAYCWHHLAEMLVLAGRRKEAIYVCRRGLVSATGDGFWNSKLDRGQLQQTLIRLLVENGEDPGAMMLDLLIEQTPDDWALVYLKGKALAIKGLGHEAIACANRLLDVDPEHLDAGVAAFDKRLFGEFAWGPCRLGTGACRQARGGGGGVYECLETGARSHRISCQSGRAWRDAWIAIVLNEAECHLVLVHSEGWQDAADFYALKHEIERIAPDIKVFVASNDTASSATRKAAARRRSLIFSPIRLLKFKPDRGKIYAGRPMSRLDEIRGLAEGGMTVPVFEPLTPNTRIDPNVFGPLTILKPNYDLASYGTGVELHRTASVRYRAPDAFPDWHPGSKDIMLVQRYVDCGLPMTCRVLTFFGKPIFSYLRRAKVRMDLPDTQDTFEQSLYMPAPPNVEVSLTKDPEILAFASKAHQAMPDIALQGCDILCEAGTGMLYLLEINPGGGTWIFSNQHSDGLRFMLGIDDLWAPFDARNVMARELIDRTRAEAC